MHQIQRRPTNEILDELRAFIERSGLSQLEIARNVGVNQATISRVMSGVRRRENLSQALIKLCNYANILINHEVPANPETNEDLMNALSVTWDGTSRHAKGLARVIREIGALSRSGSANRR